MIEDFEMGLSKLDKNVVVMCSLEMNPETCISCEDVRLIND